MSELFTEELNFLKEQSKLFFKLKENKEFLFEKINELKNDKKKLSALINFYKEKVIRDTKKDKGAVNIVRYTLLQKLEKDETVTDEVIKDLQKNYLSKNLNFWKDYIPINVIDVINEKIINYPQGKNPFNSWSPFSICYVFLYDKEMKDNVTKCLEKLSKKMCDDLNLKNKNYKTEITNFVGSQEFGSEFLIIHFKPSLGSNQLSFVICDGKMCSTNRKIDEKKEAKYYRQKKTTKTI